MNIQYDFYKIFNSNDIITCCQNFNNFIDEVGRIHNRKGILRNFQEQIGQHLFDETLISATFNKKFCYRLSEGIDALRNYCAIMIENNAQNYQIDNNIQFLKDSLSSILLLGEGGYNIITAQFIKEFMEYLNNKYKIYSKISSIYINIINYNNQLIDGCTINTNPQVINCQYVFLHKTHKPNTLPQSVFIHELGHVLQNTYNHNNNTTELPQCFANYINKSPRCASVERIKPQHIPEVFADLISLGMVYNTPYLKYHELYKDTSDIFQMELHGVFKEFIKKL